jgi:hypothetical protein
MRPERRILLKNISTCDSSRLSKLSKTLITSLLPPGEMFIVVTKDYLLPFPSQWILILTGEQTLLNRDKLDIIGHAVACERVVPIKDDGIFIDIHYRHLDWITAF